MPLGCDPPVKCGVLKGATFLSSGCLHCVHDWIPSRALTGQGAGLFIQTRIAESSIFGRGLFAAEPIIRGKIICFFAIGAQVITEDRFLQAVRDDERGIVRTGTRYAGKYFTHGNELEPYTFINHSFTPNLLCHCGIVIARADIAADEELTLDYRYLVDDTETGVYHDSATGRAIRGFSARQTFLDTARELIGLLEMDPEWQG